jgi:hypothetical protein
LLADRNFDGRGQLLVRVYDIAAPPTTEKPLVEIYLGDPSEISVAELPPQRIDGLPELVYVRTSFIDNLQIHQVGYTVGGAWLGGSDYSAGINSNLLPVNLTLGQATSVVQPLTALRALRATLTVGSSLTPHDNAQGPIAVTGYRTNRPMPTSAIVASARGACADLSGNKPSDVSGWLIGSGKIWLSGSLDDFNVGRLLFGSLYNWDSALGEIPAVDGIEVGADQYLITHTIVLNTAVAISGQKPASYSCP